MFLNLLNIDEVKHAIQVGLIFVNYGKISPCELCIREVSEVIFEFLETELDFLIKDIIGVDVGLVRVCWRRGGG